jgi:hypothetical protein
MEMDVTTLASLNSFSQCIAVSAELGLADILGDASLPSAKVAELAGANPDAVRFLLEWLVSAGVFQCDDAGKFSNNALSEPLRSDHPQSRRHICMLFGGMYYQAWGALRHTVLTGKPGFNHALGDNVFRFKESHPEEARVYDLAMEDLARPVSQALLECFDMSAHRVVVDVGGGGGALLRGILGPHEQLRGICADRPEVCGRGAAELERMPNREIAERLSFEAADFFTAVPAGGDLYILKNVLFDWNNDSRRRILETIGRAMRQTAARDAREQPRLLVIEPFTEAPHSLFQMVICEEGTRRLDEDGMNSLLRSASFNIVSVKQLPTQHTVYECLPCLHSARA